MGERRVESIMMHGIKKMRTKADKSGHKAPHLCRTSGMTLTEVIIAVAVIAVALTGTMSAYVSAERINTTAREEQIAQAAIAQMISRIRATPFNNLLLTYDPNNPNGSTTSGWTAGPFYVPGTEPATTPSGATGTIYRVMPLTLPVDVGGDKLPHGCDVGLTKFTTGEPGVQMGARWYRPCRIPPPGQPLGQPEMRIVFINNEDPVEFELGATSDTPGTAGYGDGLDLNRDGQISTTPFPTNPPLDFSVFTDTGAQPLFPRRLGSASPLTAVNQYLGIGQLLVLPVAVQVRWWSAAGVPREITVVTFVTSRS